MTDKEKEWMPLPVRFSVSKEEPKQLYQERKKITKEKYKHLQELKMTIPEEYHEFYDNLPHQ